MVNADQERIARALPGYEIGEEIGRGAYGVVVTATHRQLGRAVAVKQLPKALASDPAVRRRFVKEARLLAALDHPHIVPIYDYVEGEGLCLLVMELLSGGTVWRQFTREGVSAVGACSIVVAASSALHHAHARGILHRDIKPENLLFSEARTLKVSDFGIAKVVGGAETLGTRTGEVLGTPAYMAPEQALGTELSPATDVYALGTVLYELLSGQLPFPIEGNALASLFRHVYEEPTPLAGLRSDVSPSLCEVTMRSLAREAADRYATAEDFGVAVADAATSTWGSGWVRDSGVQVLVTGRLGERLSGTAQEGKGRTDDSARSMRAVRTATDHAPADLVGSLLPVQDIAAAQTATLPAAMAKDPAARWARPRRSVGLFAVVLVVAALGGGGAYLLLSGPSPRPHQAAAVRHPPALVDTIRVGSGADHLAIGAGAVWVTNRSARTVERIDPSSNGTATVGHLKQAPHAIVFAQGVLWVTTDEAVLLRVQPGISAVVTTEVALAAPVSELADGDGAIWASSPRVKGLVRIEESARRVVTTIPVGDSPDSVAFGGGGVWVANRLAAGTVTRVDPRTNRVVATIRVGARPDELAYGAGSLWAANSGDGTLSRIDPATNKVVATIPVGKAPQWVTVEATAVWVTDASSTTLYRVDPATNKVTDQVQVGVGAEATQVGEGSVWVVNRGDGTVRRIAPNG